MIFDLQLLNDKKIHLTLTVIDHKINAVVCENIPEYEYWDGKMDWWKNFMTLLHKQKPNRQELRSTMK